MGDYKVIKNLEVKRPGEPPLREAITSRIHHCLHCGSYVMWEGEEGNCRDCQDHAFLLVPDNTTLVGEPFSPHTCAHCAARNYPYPNNVEVTETAYNTVKLYCRVCGNCWTEMSQEARKDKVTMDEGHYNNMLDLKLAKIQEKYQEATNKLEDRLRGLQGEVISLRDELQRVRTANPQDAKLEPGNVWAWKIHPTLEDEEGEFYFPCHSDAIKYASLQLQDKMTGVLESIEWSPLDDMMSGVDFIINLSRHQVTPEFLEDHMGPQYGLEEQH